MKGITAIRGTSVYIVYEYPYADKDAHIHGVYTDRQTANLKAATVLWKRGIPMTKMRERFAILKKPIEGRKEKVLHVVCEEAGLDKYYIDNTTGKKR